MKNVIRLTESQNARGGWHKVFSRQQETSRAVAAAGRKRMHQTALRWH
jgi:hypothetical protein